MRRPLATRALIAAVAVIAALVLVALSFVDGGIGPLVAVPGAILVLWLPGRALSTALVPNGLSTAERLAVDLAGSISLTIVMGIVLGVVGIPLGRPAWAISLAAVTVAFAIASAVRVSGASPEEAADRAAPRRPVTTPLDVGLVGLAALLVVGAFAVARFGASAQPRDHFSQLWVVPAAETVTIGVRSEEAAPLTYRVVLTAPGAANAEWSDIKLAPGEQWEQRVSLAPDRQTGAVVALYRSDAPGTVYRRVALGPTATGP